jgi:hypothetical protein
MRDYNNNDESMKSMIWMMVICCAVPLVLILLFGAGAKVLGAPKWVVLGGIAVMVVAHFLVMGKSREHSNEEHGITDNKAKKNTDCCKELK